MDRFMKASEQHKNKFADFQKKAWEKFGAKPALTLPEDWKVKPVPYNGEPITTVNVPIEEVITPVVIEEERIVVIPDENPIIPTPDIEGRNICTIDFYGTALKFIVPLDEKPALASLDNADIFRTLSEFDNVFSPVLRQCLSARYEYNLCDWAYVEMLDKLSKAIYGTYNEATLLLSYLFLSSDLKMCLGKTSDNLYLLFASKSNIFNRGYFEIDGEGYYVWGNEPPSTIEAINFEFPKATGINLNLRHTPKLKMNYTEPRLLVSKNGNISVEVSVNKNLVKFYNDYPRFFNMPDFMTRWAFYADTPLDNAIQVAMYPVLKTQMSGMTRVQSLQELLHFVQTAFRYELDDVVWGEDRPFFAEESLFYKYCDCEDRSILFSRLVRDLLDMDVVLVYYPGHLATAVKTEEDIPGDYITLADGKYLICDPTYIGAPIGVTMPNMDNKTAKVILLQR